MYLEWRFRRAMPGTSHDDYLDEPEEHRLWFPKFTEHYG